MSPAADKPQKICLRGLPANTELRTIQKDLRDRGFDAIFLRHVDAKGQGTGVFCVQLQITPEISKVFDIKKMLGVPVKVEAWRGRQGPPQCQRCQGFRHSAAECLREYRCVHCARPHPSKQCNLPYDIPTCANCRGPHAANDFNCPAIRREIIAKAGLVLRTSGYELATPKPVDESNAPSSLMAEANEKWIDIKRKRRRRKAQDKTRTPTSELQQSQETQLPLVKSGIEKKLPTQETQPKAGLKKPISKEAIMKTPTISHKVQSVLVGPTKEKNFQLPQQVLPEKTLNDNIIENSSQAVLIDRDVPIPEIMIQTTHIEPVNGKIQQIPEVPMESVTNRTRIETVTNPDAVRDKVVYECVAILQNVLSAIQLGDNPVPIILESLAQLYKDV